MNEELKNYSALQFFKDRYRVMKECKQPCIECPVSRYNNGENIHCTNLFSSNSEKYIELVYNWAKKNPEPFEPKHDERYWVPVITLPILAYESYWNNCIDDKFRKKHNLIFKTKEEAIARAKELLGIKEEG